MALPSQQAAKELGGVPFSYPMLTTSSYTTWAIKMEAIMDAQGIWEAIESEAGVAVEAKTDERAKAFIFQCIPEDFLLQVAKKKNAMEVWEALKIRCLGADRVQKARLQTLKSELEALRMKETDSVDEFAGKLSSMAAKFSSLGTTLEDEALVKKLLDSVPEKFFQLVASIEQYSDLDEMPFEEAIGRLKAYEERIRLRAGNGSGSTEGRLLLTQSEDHSRQKGGNSREISTNSKCHSSRSDWRGRGRWHGRGRGRGRGGRSNNEGRHDSAGNNRTPRNKSHIKCFNCDKFGHYASECRLPKRKDEEVNLSRAQEDEPALLLAVCEQR